MIFQNRDGQEDYGGLIMRWSKEKSATLRRKMPYVNIKVTKEGVTAEPQKVKLIEGVTRLLKDVR